MTIVTVRYESYVEDMKTMDVTSNNCVRLDGSKTDIQLINIAVDYVRSVDRTYHRLISVEIVAR